MSMFDNDNYQWRETFFVFFGAENRPAAAQVETAGDHRLAGSGRVGLAFMDAPKPPLIPGA